jgi:hypothetical protein
MKILGIESSCDETGVALVEAFEVGTPRLLAQALHSQVDMHQAYGGVVPELASRDHIRRVLPLTRQVMADAGHALDAIDVVAYTRGPGLAGAPAWPARWPRRSVGRPSACITSRATCCRRSCQPTRRAFRSSRCWCRAGTRS